MKVQKNTHLTLVLLFLLMLSTCKSDHKNEIHDEKDTIDSITLKIDGIPTDTSNQKPSPISKAVLKERDSLLRKQIAASKMISMSCDEILEKYRLAMRAAKEGDMSKLTEIDPNDPIFNKCKSTEPFKSKFEAIDLEYTN